MTRAEIEKKALTRAALTALLLLVVFTWKAHAQSIGVPGTANPVKSEQIAGTDGTTLRTLKTDASGQLITTGPTGTSAQQSQGTAASGAAPVGNPNAVAGYDTGGNVIRTLSVNGSGVLANIVPAADADAAPNNPTGFGVTNLGSAPLAVFNHCFNGTTWDRCRGNTDGWFLGKNTTGTDALGNTLAFPNANSAAGLLEAPTVFNGTTWDRQRSISVANAPTAVTTTARNSVGAAIVENGSRFTVVSTPAVSTLASASIAAEASVRHVATGVCFSAGSTTAPALTKLNVNLRDGASGAGTIIASWTVVIAATTGQNVNPTCFPIGPYPGTTNTAMTLEFSALLTNLFEDVTLTGYNVN